MADTALASEPARDTAAEHMVTGIPRARIDTIVDQVIEALRGSSVLCHPKPSSAFCARNTWRTYN